LVRQLPKANGAGEEYNVVAERISSNQFLLVMKAT
jgi:hypothetical protein